MKTSPRMRRVSESVHQALADILETELSDPRLEFVTITDVEVTGDLQLAVVYVIAHGGDERYAEALDGLRSATNRIRKELAQRVSMKFLPHLEFRIDPSVDEAMRIYEKLKEIAPTGRAPEAPDTEDSE